MVMLFIVILVSCFYMYAQILTALAKRKRNNDLQISVNFKKHIEQVSVMVIVNGGVYFLLMTIFVVCLALFSVAKYLPISFNFWENIVSVSISLNASINPLLYLLTNQRYRRAFTTLFQDYFGTDRKPDNE